MLKTALQPRMLGLLALALVIVAAFMWLGRWQYQVAEDKANVEALQAARARPVVELSSVLQPHQEFPNAESTRSVRVTGRYAAERGCLVAHRRLDGVTGYWVMTPLVSKSPAATIAVLRGFVTDPAAIPAPPAGEVTVVGALAPGESPYKGPALPEGQRGAVDLSEFVNEWPGDLWNAFVFADTEAVDGKAVDPGLRRVPSPTGESELNWRNLGYALQWWVFAVFAVVMWWRMLKQSHEKQAHEKQAHEKEGPPQKELPQPSAPGPDRV